MKIKFNIKEVQSLLSNEHIGNNFLFDTDKTAALSWLETQPLIWLNAQRRAHPVPMWDSLPDAVYSLLAAGMIARDELGCKPVCKVALEKHLANATVYMPAIVGSFKNGVFVPGLAHKNVANKIKRNGKPVSEAEKTELVMAEAKRLKAVEQKNIENARADIDEIFELLTINRAEIKQKMLRDNPPEKFPEYLAKKRSAAINKLADYVKGAYTELETKIQATAVISEREEMEALQSDCIALLTKMGIDISDLEANTKALVASADMSNLVIDIDAI